MVLGLKKSYISDYGQTNSEAVGKDTISSAQSLMHVATGSI